MSLKRFEGQSHVLRFNVFYAAEIAEGFTRKCQTSLCTTYHQFLIAISASQIKGREGN